MHLGRTSFFMKTFEYKGYDRRGGAQSGLIDGSDLKEARERLAAQGVLAERLKETRRGIRIRRSTRAVIYRELSSLLSAGVPLASGLDLLINSQEKPAVRSVLAAVRDDVRNGEGFAAAFSDASPAVTPYEKAILEAAERSATMVATLDRTAAFLENQQRVSERVQTALIYPSIVMGAGICVAILMLGLLIPRVEGLFENTGGNLPAITSFMIAVGNIVLAWSMPVLGAGVLLVIFLRRKIASDADFRCLVDEKLFSLPVFGRGYRIVANLRFAQTLGTLLNSAVPLIDAFKLASKSTGSASIIADSEKQADTIEHGGSLSQAVANIPPLRESLPGMLRVGEAGGDVVGMLDSAAFRYSTAWDRFVDRSLSLLEPLLILLIGGFVLLVTISVLMPIMSLTDTLQI